MNDRVPPYPGLHPGTGFNDHLHHWRLYEHDGREFRACTICGYPHPQDARLEKR